MGYIAKSKEINLLFPEAEGMYRRLVEAVKDGIYMADRTGNLFFVNHAFVELLGFTHRDEILGKNLIKDFYSDPKDREEFLKAIEEKGFVRDHEVKNIRKDGKTITLSVTSNFIWDERGKVIGVEGVVHDVTEKKELQKALEVEKVKLEEILNFEERVIAIHHLHKLFNFVVEKISSILESERCSLMLLDAKTQTLRVQAALGLAEEYIIGPQLKIGDDSIAGRVAKEGEPFLVKNVEYDERLRRANRPSYHSRSFVSVPLKLRGKILGVINVADKIVKKDSQSFFEEQDLKILKMLTREVAIAVENAHLYQELKQLSIMDPLTNLHNYRYFSQAFEEEIERKKRFTGKFSLLIIDIDDFKSYNDQYGHPVGDQLLRDLGGLLQNSVRAVDKVCRYGGDEFIVLLIGADLQAAAHVAEKIRKKIQEHSFEHHKITVSIGVAVYQDHLNRFQFLMQADRALYKAKAAGKNQIAVCCQELLNSSKES